MGFSFFHEEIATIFALIILIFLIVFISKKQNIPLSLKPKFTRNSKIFYILATILVAIIFTMTPFVSNSVNFDISLF